MAYDLSLNATAAHERSAASVLVRLYENWQARRDVRMLRKLDDHMLRDVGVTRADVEWASQLPLMMNATLALDERARVRRY